MASPEATTGKHLPPFQTKKDGTYSRRIPGMKGQNHPHPNRFEQEYLNWYFRERKEGSF